MALRKRHLPQSFNIHTSIYSISVLCIEFKLLIVFTPIIVTAYGYDSIQKALPRTWVRSTPRMEPGKMRCKSRRSLSQTRYVDGLRLIAKYADARIRSLSSILSYQRLIT
jgi:hypothetical protein